MTPASKLLFGAFTSLGFILSLPLNAQAAVVTFQSLVIDRLDLAGPQIEGQFRYQATIGDGWELSDRNTTTNSHLATFVDGQPSKVGDVVEFKMTNNGLFTFNSFKFATRSSVNSDDVSFIGYRNGTLVQSFVLSDSTGGFGESQYETRAVSIGSIDLLKVMVSGNTGSNAMFLDNFDFTPAPVPDSPPLPPVPLPPALPLFATGLGMVGLLGWRRKRQSIAALAAA